MSNDIVVECVDTANAVLGEGPIWDEREYAVYWVDIKQPAIHRYDPATGAVQQWPMPERIGCIARRRGQPGFIAGFKSGFAFVDLEHGFIEPIGKPEPDLPSNRLNDGKVDSNGRIWIGSMDDDEKTASGWLYRLESDLRWSRTDGPYIVTNGPTFSPDGTELFHTDTVARTIYRFTLASDGTLSNKRIFVRFEEPDWGYPDGMTTDSEGCIWVGHWGGSRVSRFDPDGRLERMIKLPASQVTSCCFAGKDLADLYVTTASIGLPEGSEPLAGGLFHCRPGVSGLPTQRFAG